MIDIRHLELIKQKHGGYASWAVWKDVAKKPKSNMGDMTIFDLDSNPALLEVLKTNFIMVGLNISRSFSEPFRNFHDASATANDFKIRYAFQNTQYSGAYNDRFESSLRALESTSSPEEAKCRDFSRGTA
jgi:hypothetical protein